MRSRVPILAAPVMVVQTYHVALVLAHHGVGWRSGSLYSPSRPITTVEVLAFEPAVHTLCTLAAFGAAALQLVRAFIDCMRQALAHMPGVRATWWRGNQRSGQ